MEKTNFKSKLYSLELAAYSVLKFIFSATIGFLFSKAGIKGELSPFSLSALSVCPTTPLSYVFMYIGSVFGHITNEFSVHNFKYICALTIILAIILISGKRIYSKSIYSPLLPCIVCFFSGLIFMFADDITLFGFLMLICETLLCFCTSFFIKQCADSFRKASKFDVKDVIAFCITLFLFVCALDNYYLYSFSLSALFVQLIIYFSSNYLSVKFTILLSAVLSIIQALLHYTNEYYLFYFFIPSLATVLVSKIEKKYIVPTYFIATATVISITSFSLYSFPQILTPIISGIIYYLIPKKEFCLFLSKYITIKYEGITNDLKENNQLCIDYTQSASSLLNKINNTFYTPILDKGNSEKIKKFLLLKKCKNIDIVNYYNSLGKQILNISFRSKNEIETGVLLEKLNDISNSNFIELSANHQDGLYSYKFEQSDIYKVECYALYKAKQGESVCGDNVCAFKAYDSFYSIVLADGMGSGKDAYNKSRDTINILKKLLASQIAPEEAIKTANASIELFKDEIGFSTIDLCYISLKTGAMDIYKCGAYTTIILRENSLIKMSGGGLPVGLYDRLHIHKHNIQLCDGDYIIMMSDGVCNAAEQIDAQLLLSSSSNIEEITKSLIECAHQNTAKEYDDDMTVIVSKFTIKQ